MIPHIPIYYWLWPICSLLNPLDSIIANRPLK